MTDETVNNAELNNDDKQKHVVKKQRKRVHPVFMITAIGCGAFCGFGCYDLYMGITAENNASVGTGVTIIIIGLCTLMLDLYLRHLTIKDI